MASTKPVWIGDRNAARRAPAQEAAKREAVRRDPDRQTPRILQPTEANLRRLAAVLRRGGIVGVPSETVYGLAANALDASACAKIFEAKGRPSTDPLIVHLASVRDLPKVAQVNEAARRLAARAWPGPLTLVLPKRDCVPALVTAGKATVAVRVPAHPVFRQLIRLAGVPLAAPSANPFGYISPTRPAHVRDGLSGTGLRAVLDGGDCEVGVESTIVDLTRPEAPRLLRPGGLAVERVEEWLGTRVSRPTRKSVSATRAAPAPGMLTQHYSPRTPLRLHARLSSSNGAAWREQGVGENDAVLLLRRPADTAGFRVGKRPPKNASAATRASDSTSADDSTRAGTLKPRIFWLSEDGELAEIARNLFSRLRELDAGGWSCLHAELPEGGEGLAPAIRDRLTRAAAKHRA